MIYSQAHSPPCKGGVAAPSIKCCEPPLKGADGKGVNKLQMRVCDSPPKLGGVPARPSSSKKGRAGGVVPKQVVARFYLGTTPSAPASVASRHFINGAATPPNLGGELSRLPIHSHLQGGRSHNMFQNACRNVTGERPPRPCQFGTDSFS